MLKLWQSRDPFDPEAFFAKIRSGKYDWADLRRLVRTGEEPQAEEVVRAVETRYGFLRWLAPIELELIADAKKGRATKVAQGLGEEIRTQFGLGS